MKSGDESVFSRIFRETSGQTLPFIALLMIPFLGIAGLTLDLGRAYVCYRQLQASTDAAALAGAYAMSLPTATTTSVKTTTTAFSSVSPGVNVNPNLPAATISITLECLQRVVNMGVQCSASPTGDNAIVVTQTALMQTTFIRALGAFGLKMAQSLTLNTTATAAMRGATNAQYNVALVLDTTASMGSNDSDASCGTTRIKCALSGVQTLLQSLSPCTPSSTSTSCTGFDQVSLFTFPNVEADTAQNDYTCPTSNPKIPPYSTPTPGAAWVAPTGTAATYQITSYLNDYSSTNKSGGALNTSSALSIATGASSSKNCSGVQTPGGDGTYYAGAIYAALSSLAAAQSANPGSLNALVILSDGDASTTKMSGTLTGNGVYPSLKDQCQQAITAAQSAPKGTTVYTIAYGASSSGGNGGCSTDTSGSQPGISPCSTLQQMASSPADFYSDATASQNKGQCISSSNPNLSLNGIFQQVATQFTVARLIPN
jgi:hypothetical protein